MAKKTVDIAAKKVAAKKPAKTTKKFVAKKPQAKATMKVKKLKPGEKANATLTPTKPASVPSIVTSSETPAKPKLSAEAKAVYAELKPVAREINGLLEVSERNATKASDQRLAAALHIASAKLKCEAAGVNFKTWATANLKVSYETARKLIPIGDAKEPAKALQDLRAKNAEANRVHRTKQRVVLKKASREVKKAEGGEGTIASLQDVKDQFMLLSTTDKMSFLEWGAQEVGGKFDLGL